MSGPNSRDRIFAAVLALCVGLAAGGVWLVLHPGDRKEARTNGPGQPGPPAWLAAAPLRQQFEGRLQPMDAAAAQEVLGRLTAQLSPALAALTDLRAQIDVNRTLLDGYEYAARLTLSQEPVEGGRRLEMEVRRAGEGPALIQVDVAGTRLTRIAMIAVDTRDTLFVLDRLDPARVEQLLKLPVALGDLQIQDLLGLLEGLGRGSIHVAGRLEAAHALHLLAISVEFPAADAAADSTAGPAEDSRGASALLYFDTDNLSLRALRVFNRAGRLVRVADDFVFGGTAGAPTLQSFRVASLPTASHSLFQLRAMGSPAVRPGAPER